MGMNNGMSREDLINDCKRDIKRYEQCGRVLYDYSWVRIANIQVPIDEITLHRGLEYGKATMKLQALHDTNHSEDEIDRRLKQIDGDIHLLEEALKHDLEFRGLLIRP